MSDLMEHFDATAEFKFADAETMQRGEFEGYASTFGNVDLGGDVVERGAFTETLKKRAPADIALFFNHKSLGVPIGDWVEMRENDRGLVVKGRIDLEDPEGRRVHNAMAKGRLRGLSIGYRVTPGGSEMVRGVRRLKSLELHEISVVTSPMNTRAQMSRVKAAFDLDAMDAKDWREIEAAFRMNGYSRADAVKAVATLKDWLRRDAGAPESLPRDEVGAAVAELLRRNIATLS